MKFTMKWLFLPVLAAGLALGLSGCPPHAAPGKARVITLFSGNATPAKSLVEAVLAGTKQGPVPLSAIESLTVTVTGVTLLRADESDDATGEVVFNGAVDVDVITLFGLSEVLSEVEVPAGTYSRIVLEIQDPRLVLAAEPDVVIEGEEIQLTANGRLFLEQTFTLPAGQTSLVLLDFQDLHLVEQGNGGFTLTPQVRADNSVTNAEVTLEGTIVSINTDTNVVVIALADGEIEVIYTAADIFLTTDGDVPSGEEIDLLVNATVRVDGLMQVDGSVEATAVYLVE